MKMHFRVSCLLIVILIDSFSAVHAQKTLHQPDKLAAYEMILKPIINDTSLALPFNKIEIIDSRFDTSKIGYAAFFLRDNWAYRQVTIQKGLTNALQSFLNEYYKNNFSNNDKALVIVIKTLWLHQTSLSERGSKKFIWKNSENDREINESVAKVETYIKHNNAYQALYKIDTSFQSDRPLHKVIDELLLAAFKTIITKTAASNVTVLLDHRKQLEFEAINKYNISRFLLPCLSNDSLQKGVYLTFQDFVNKRVTYKDFAIDEGELTDELYITQNGNKVLLTDFWGFCDGSSNYINLGFNFYPIIKHNNTYEFWGNDHLTHEFHRYKSNSIHLTDLVLGYIGNTNNTKNFLRPMQINMETGKAY